MSLATEDLQHGGYSSSPGLSSPPTPNSPTHQSDVPTSFARDTSFAHNGQNDANVGGARLSKTIAAKNASAVVKRPRKKRDPESTKPNTGNTSTTATDAQEKPRTRAPRGTSEAFKKRQAKAQAEKEAQAAKDAEALQGPRQTKPTESLPSSSLPPAHFDVPAIHTPPQIGNNEAIPIPPQINTPNFAGQVRPTSGQNYDPIRSSTAAPRASSPLASSHTPQKVYQNISASASPSINSLIDPPPNSMSNYSHASLLKRESDGKASTPPEPKRPRLSPPITVLSQQQSNASPINTIVTAPQQHRSPAPMMEIDVDKAPTPSSTVTIKKPSPKASTGVSTSSHSPKPSRPKESALALSSGSGLLSGSIFGGGYDSAGPEKAAPTVVLDVKLGGDNQYVNFTRLAEERYGFNALHPRLAAQRERLARVAAAGAALENAHKSGGNSGSGDDMSVDLSDGDGDNSNVEMGGMVDGERMVGKSGEETGEAGTVKKPRKRMMKEDMYDKEDDFIDDTELIWEEQAATSKDGFFVYSGPLIPAGEEPTVER